jgi:hypothetical protein
MFSSLGFDARASIASSPYEIHRKKLFAARHSLGASSLGAEGGAVGRIWEASA